VQGIATAAGTQLAAQADLCVASPQATFATPGVQRGGFCTTPSVAISRSIKFPKQALRMLLTGERFSAQCAYEFGLVSHVSEGDLDEFTATLAADIAKAASTTLFLGKRGYYEQMDMGVVEAYDFAGKVMAGNFCMRDSKEGVSAFFEKRAPKWD
jgi:enoyl-CoA hydratase/carnithine racemase